MATPEQYAEWIVANADKQGTPEFDTVAEAYQLAKAQPPKGEYQQPEWLTSLQGEQARIERDTPSPAMGALNTFAKGASFGGADELAGLASFATGGDYDSAREDFERVTDKHAEISPVSAFAAELGGGLASSVPMAKYAGMAIAAAPKVAAAISSLPKWMQIGGAGGAAGGTYGALDADPGERLEGAGTGAALGGAVGLATPAAIAVGGYGAKKLASGVTRALRAGSRKLLGSTDDDAAKQLAQALRRDEMTPEMFESTMRKGGPDMIVADAGGENIKSLGETLTSLPGKTRNAVQSLEKRAVEAQHRIVASLKDTLGVDNVNFDKAVGGLHEKMREIGKGYASVYENIVDLTKPLTGLMSRPSIQSGLKQAQKIAADEGDTAFREFLDVDPKTRELIWKKAPTLKAWDYVKRGLDDVIDAGTDPTTGKLSADAVRALKNKQAMLKEIDSVAPDYATLRANYSDEKASESALMLGRKFMREDSEVTARRLAEMSEPEKQYFRLGGARAIYDKVMNSIDTGTSWRALIKKPLVREKITTLFPDRSARAKFMRTLETELKFADTRTMLNPRGKSPTGRIGAGQADLSQVPELVDSITQAASSRPARALTTMYRALRNVNGSGIPEKLRDEIGEVLLSNDPKAISRVYAEMLRQGKTQPIKYAPIQNAAPVAALSGRQAAATDY